MLSCSSVVCSCAVKIQYWVTQYWQSVSVDHRKRPVRCLRKQQARTSVLCVQCATSAVWAGPEQSRQAHRTLLLLACTVAHHCQHTMRHCQSTLRWKPHFLYRCSCGCWLHTVTVYLLLAVDQCCFGRSASSCGEIKGEIICNVLELIAAYAPVRLLMQPCCRLHCWLACTCSRITCLQLV